MLLPSCLLPSFEVQAGYAELSVDGDIGYRSGSGAAIQQDTQSAFGLGDDQGSPYVRAQLDFGVPVLTVSGFTFEDEGRGRLEAQFGDNPALQAGAPVQSAFEMNNAKASYTFDIGLGPVSISPGIGVDYFDLLINVQDAFGIATEQVDLTGPLPLLLLRAEVDLSIVSAFVEAGYVAADVDDVDGELFDIEAQLAFRPTPLIDLFVGYRHVQLAVDGQIDGDQFDTDITISGLMVGGGVRF